MFSFLFLSFLTYMYINSNYHYIYCVPHYYMLEMFPFNVFVNTDIFVHSVVLQNSFSDISNFDPEFTEEMVPNSVCWSQEHSIVNASVMEADDAFVGFSYAPPSEDSFLWNIPNEVFICLNHNDLLWLKGRIFLWTNFFCEAKVSSWEETALKTNFGQKIVCLKNLYFTNLYLYKYICTHDIFKYPFSVMMVSKKP